MDGNELTARFIHDTRWGSLPEPVQRKARMILMDNVGAALAGTVTRVARITADYAAAAWRGEEATILLRGLRSTTAGAAFANGWAANGIDVDDGIQYAYGHAGAQIFPTVLAVAEARNLSGARLLGGMVAGYEVAHRVGRCWHDHQEIYQACGSWGSVACAAAAANLMDLSVAQNREALGIAEYHAPNLPMMRDIDDPGMVKHGIGWGAMTGVISAELAARGFTGIPSILGFEQYQEWVQDVGEHYIMVDGVAWKSRGYACCSWAHPAMEGAHLLVEKHHIDLDEIDVIHVEGFHETVRLGTRLPETTEQAQFNLAWPVAAMLVDGEVGPAQTLEERLQDPQIRALARRVEVVEKEELNELNRLYFLGEPGGLFASEVTIRLKDGRTYASGLVASDEAYPPVGWDEARMEKKVRWLAGLVLDEKRVDTLIDILEHFEELGSVRDLTGMLR
jgi:2-methylcitrate dehydratase PrpD